MTFVIINIDKQTNEYQEIESLLMNKFPPEISPREMKKKKKLVIVEYPCGSGDISRGGKTFLNIHRFDISMNINAVIREKGE